jgi:hypothetical protein
MISLSLNRTRDQRAAPVATRVALSFRDGERLVVDVDAENGSYLRAAFARRGRRSFDWFETRDGFLIGIDLAAIEAIDWHPPAAPAPELSPLDRHHLALRFGRGAVERFEQIAPEDIDRLRGVTIGGCAGKRFAPDGAGSPAASVALQGLELATLPVFWMDAEER